MRIFSILFLFLPALALAATPKASSELKDSDGVKHTADKAFDGLLQTGWAEGVADAGNGAWLELKLDRPTEIHSVSVWPGNLSEGSRSVREYGRPKLITVTLVTPDGEVTRQERLPDLVKEGPRRVDVTVSGAATLVKVTIDEAYEGYVFNDTFIAEVALNFVGGAVPDAVDKAKKWEGTPAAEAAADRNKKQIVEWFDAIRSAEFGDRDTLQKIMDQAADGAPFMRDRTRNVPYGYRVHALPPDEVAIEALRKLKDANAIPALELASTRVTGKEAKELTSLVEYFYAYQEWVGGPNYNLKNWGETGWSTGALKSYGEPFGVVLDQFGDLYVADVANNRVQRFDPSGKATRVWGGSWGEEPAVTNDWFGQTRRYYVSGGKPGDKHGQFEQPVDIALVPGKHADGFAVLDAGGRVQTFDGDGNPAAEWKIDADGGIGPGVGGEGYIELVGSSFVVVWGNEAFVYTKTGEEKARFDLDDGVPKGSAALKNGKIALIFEDELVMYSLDGFRHGDILGDGDERGAGFEDWDATIDEKGKLWVMTDTGLAVKYKKPGKVDYVVDISEANLKAPRFVAYDDVLFIVAGDRIRRIDALELKAKAELAAQEAAEQ